MKHTFLMALLLGASICANIANASCLRYLGGGSISNDDNAFRFEFGNQIQESDSNGTSIFCQFFARLLDFRF